MPNLTYLGQRIHRSFYDLDPRSQLWYRLTKFFLITDPITMKLWLDFGKIMLKTFFGEFSLNSLNVFLAATKQLYEWYFLSICPSLRPSVHLSARHTFLTMFPSSYHHEIFRSYYQFTNDRSDVHAKGQGQRSKVKVTEVITQLSCFQTVTAVWIHIWWWTDA